MRLLSGLPFWVWLILNYKKQKLWKTFVYKKNVYFDQLTFNPGLV